MLSERDAGLLLERLVCALREALFGQFLNDASHGGRRGSHQASALILYMTPRRVQLLLITEVVDLQRLVLMLDVEDA